MKIQDGNIILSSTEIIKFPNNEISDSGSGLSIAGSVDIDAGQIGGVDVDSTTIVDQGVLTYDLASGKLKFVI